MNNLMVNKNFSKIEDFKKRIKFNQKLGLDKRGDIPPIFPTSQFVLLTLL